MQSKDYAEKTWILSIFAWTYGSKIPKTSITKLSIIITIKNSYSSPFSFFFCVLFVGCKKEREKRKGETREGERRKGGGMERETERGTLFKSYKKIMEGGYGSTLYRVKDQDCSVTVK